MTTRQRVGALMVLIGFIGAVLLWWPDQASVAPPAADVTPSPSQIVTSPEEPTVAPPASGPTPDRVEPKPSELVRLNIPGVLLANSGGAIVPNELNQLNPPNSEEVFRWADRGLPGCNSDDTTYILGHTVREGPGVFDELQAIHPGQQITLRTRTGIVRYEVTRIRSVARDGVVGHDWIYRPIPGRLILIGCRLNPDGSPQTDNFIVVAKPQCG